MPIVSVIIPCFNQAKYLRSAVDSVLVQDFGDHEIIIVDDGSTDGTWELAESLQAENPGRDFVLVKGDRNHGLPEARNAGIERASGKLVLPLDADDILHPQYLSSTTAALKPGQAHVAYTDRIDFGAACILREVNNFNPKVECLVNQIGYCSLYVKDIWKQIGGYRGAAVPGYEDWEFWIAACERGLQFVHVPGVLWFYRLRPGSMSSQTALNQEYLEAWIVGRHPRSYCPETVKRSAEIFAKGPVPSD